MNFNILYLLPVLITLSIQATFTNDFAYELVKSTLSEEELKERLANYSLDGLNKLQLDLKEISCNAQKKIDNKNSTQLFNTVLAIGSLYSIYKGFTTMKKSTELLYAPVDLTISELLIGINSKVNRAEAEIMEFVGFSLVIAGGLGLLIARPFHSYDEEARIIQKVTMLNAIIDQIAEERIFQQTGMHFRAC